MNWTNALIDILLFFFVIVCVLMCLTVLMQRSKQEGLGTTFGGGFTNEILGTGTSAFLVKTTVVMATLFFLLSICLARLYTHRAAMLDSHLSSSAVQAELQKSALPTGITTNAAPSLPVVPLVKPVVNVVPLPAATTNKVVTPVPLAKPAK